MASTTSVISLFVLLLATYCYSGPLPVVQRLTSTTPGNDFTTTTEKPMEHKMNMRLVPDEEVNGMPKMENPMPTGEHMIGETTTPLGFESGSRQTRVSEPLFESSSPMTSTEFTSSESGVTHEPRRSEPFVESSSPMTSTEFSSTLKHGLRGFEDTTTMETSTKFDSRAIKGNMESEKESTTMIPNDESTTEPSSSVESFGKTTGLLDGKRPEEKETTTVSEETTTPVTEETTTESFVKPGKLRKVITVIPGTSRDITIHGVPNKQIVIKNDVPNKEVIVKTNVPQERRQLNQGQSEKDVQKRNWDN